MSLESADIRELDNLPETGRLHGAMVGRVHLQGLMNPPLVIEIGIASQNSAQVPLVQDNDIVETLAAQGPNHPFRVGPVPRRDFAKDSSVP